MAKAIILNVFWLGMIALANCYYIPFENNKDKEYLNRTSNEYRIKGFTENDEASIKIASVTECVSCISSAVSKYCRDITLTSGEGYCCDAADQSENCGGSANSICSNDETRFPSGSQYLLCPIAKSSSFCGASEDLEFHVSNDAEILINAYSVKEGEMCDYMIKSNDKRVSGIKVNVLTSTNLEVLIAKQSSNSSYISVTPLSNQTTYSNVVYYGDIYKILARAVGGTGVLVLQVDGPHNNLAGYETKSPVSTPFSIVEYYFLLYLCVFFTLIFSICLIKIFWNKIKLLIARKINQKIYSNKICLENNNSNFIIDLKKSRTVVSINFILLINLYF